MKRAGVAREEWHGNSLEWAVWQRRGDHRRGWAPRVTVRHFEQTGMGNSRMFVSNKYPSGKMLE